MNRVRSIAIAVIRSCLIAGALFAAERGSHASAEDAPSSPHAEFAATPRQLMSLLQEPLAAACSPDLELLATAHGDGGLYLWNVDAARPVHSLTGHTGPVASVAFDARAERLASASYDGTVRLWDVLTGANIRVLDCGGVRMGAVALSADGSWVIAGGSDKQVRFWNVAAPSAESATLSGHEAAVTPVAYSATGDRFVTADASGAFILWNAETRAEIARGGDRKSRIDAIAFSPDGGMLAVAGDNGQITLWNAASAQPSDVTVDSHGAAATAVCYSSDGALLATADRRGSVRVWKTSNGQPAAELDGHSDEICAIRFAPDTQSIITVGLDRVVNVWRSKLPATPRLATIEAAGARLWSLAAAPDGKRIYASGRKGLLQAWNLGSGAIEAKFDGFPGTLDAICLSPDGSLVAGCGWKEKVVHIWDTSSGIERAKIELDARVRCVRFAPNAPLLVAGCEDGAFRIWSYDGKPDEKPVAHSAGPLPVSDVCFSPDGSLMATASGDWQKQEPGTVGVWRFGTWSKVREMREHSLAVRSVAFSPDGSRLASAGEDNLLVISDASSGAVQARLQNGAPIRPIAFSPDGNSVAAALRDGTIYVWDLARGEVVRRLVAEDDVFAIGFSSDGSALFSVSGEERIEIWPVGEAVSGSVAEQIRAWTPPQEK